MIYETKGTCAKEIQFEVDHGVIRSVEFVLGCPGFTQALQCLDKGTSCPDQLALALMQIQESNEK